MGINKKVFASNLVSPTPCTTYRTGLTKNCRFCCKIGLSNVSSPPWDGKKLKMQYFAAFVRRVQQLPPPLKNVWSSDEISHDLSSPTWSQLEPRATTWSHFNFQTHEKLGHVPGPSSVSSVRSLARCNDILILFWDPMYRGAKTSYRWVLCTKKHLILSWIHGSKGFMICWSIQKLWGMKVVTLTYGHPVYTDGCFSLWVQWLSMPKFYFTCHPTVFINRVYHVRVRVPPPKSDNFEYKKL